MEKMIYHKGKPIGQNYTGLEHLEPGQSAFHWRAKPKPLDEEERKTEAQRIYARHKYHADKAGMTVKAWRAQEAIKRAKFSNIAYSTRGAGDRTAKLSKTEI